MKKEDLEKTIEKLRRQRDELKVKIHLAKADAKEEWAAAEKKYAQLKTKTESLAATGGEIAKELGETIKEVSEDIMNGYERISAILKK
jgi:chromosome segregation ATPase